MKIKDWMKLGAGVVLVALDETDKKLKDSKPENEEES